MGTRHNPGRFDCHGAALNDEEQFTLLARDPLAGFLVSLWGHIRCGDFEAADCVFRTMLERAGVQYCVEPDLDKAFEALDCAMAMFRWREANLGRWREVTR